MAKSGTIALIIIGVCLVPTAWVGIQDLNDRLSVAAQVSSLETIARKSNLKGDTESAIVALRTARRLAPADRSVERQLLLAECALSAEKPSSLTRAGALSLAVRLQAADLEAADHPEVAVALGQLEVFHGRMARSKVLFEAAVKHHPKSGLAHYSLAKSHIIEKTYDAAITALETSIKLDPKSVMYRQAMGRTLARQEKWGGAVEAFARAVELENTPLNQLRLGEAQLKLGNHESAIKSLQNAKKGLTQPEQMGRVQAALGFALFKAGKLAESAVEFESAARIRQDSSVLFNLGTVRHALGQHRLAMLAFQAGLKGQPGNTGAHVELMKAFLGLGQKEQARKVRARLARLAQNNPSAKTDLRKADALLGTR